jgi:hypothetical protein
MDDNIIDDIRQYAALKSQAELLTTRQNEVKKRLTAAVDSVGATDDRGHIVLDVNDETSGVKRILKQRRVSKTLDMDVAEDILSKKGIKDACIKMIPTLDESAIMAAFYEGHLTEQDIDTMFPSKVSYAFIVETR